MKSNTIFIAFPIDNYERAELAKMDNQELQKFALAEMDREDISDDDLPKFYSPAEIAECLNDECTFSEKWLYAVTVSETDELYTIL